MLSCDRLKKAEIIPTVLDAFAPLLEVSIDWQNATADYGNTINPHKTKHQPDVELVNVDSALWPDVKSTPQLTLAMTDPDAPSRDNPEWSEICHWIVTNVKLIKSSQDSDDASDDVDPLKKRMLDVMPYKPPGPPPETGKHRYVYVALVPKNGTTDTLHLKRPDDRQHWGYEHERQGLRMWAEEMGLKVVGTFGSSRSQM